MPKAIDSLTNARLPLNGIAIAITSLSSVRTPFATHMRDALSEPWRWPIYTNKRFM